eukprot:gb/GEZN01005944.1/.p1 GENE.gb/GEZN01005944.1/~~gb/GEZN01005944.1/.p1  ORF type:complete len:376 (+),score=36.83 gb/GEZN01005944.1/:47-1174(+)
MALTTDDGFPVEWFAEPQPDPSFICSICNGVFRIPVQTANPTEDDPDPCGHTFCQTCIKEWLRRRKSCPSCRRPLSADQLHKDIPLQRRVAELKAVCPIDPVLCKVTGEAGKDGVFWTEHAEICRFQKLACSGCSKLFVLQELQAHFKKCRKVKVMCPLGCGLSLKRIETAKHEKECLWRPAAEVPCKFSAIGCKHTSTRSDLAAHMQTAMCEHMDLMLAKLAGQLSVGGDKGTGWIRQSHTWWILTDRDTESEEAVLMGMQIQIEKEFDTSGLASFNLRLNSPKVAHDFCFYCEVHDATGKQIAIYDNRNPVSEEYGSWPIWSNSVPKKIVSVSVTVFGDPATDKPLTYPHDLRKVPLSPSDNTQNEKKRRDDE